MSRPKYKYRNLRKRIQLKYYTVSPNTKYFFSFHNEWLESRLEHFWNAYYDNFRYYRSLAYSYKVDRPVKYLDEKRSFFVIDPLYSEDPFDDSKIFVDSVPFDDDEFGEDLYEPENYFFDDNFEFDDFFLENFFLFVFLIFIFFPMLFPFFLFVSIFFIIVIYEECVIYDNVDHEHEDWDLIDDDEEDEAFEVDYIFLIDDDYDDDSEFEWSTRLYTYAEFVFLDFFTFDEFFVLGRPWVHKPFHTKFLKIFKFN